MIKLQCDVCAAEAATVFCCADEAALCDACDRLVHCANKLAGKHQRFSLLHDEPTSASSAQKNPLCDECKERRGLLFCKEERKILCRECDLPSHTATVMTRSHSRFLLTGVRLSSTPVDAPVVPEKQVMEEENSSNADSCSAGVGASDRSCVTEYFTKTLPGWPVEDFLVDDADAGIAACSDGLDLAPVGGLLDEAFPPWAAGDQVLSADLGGSREQCVPQTEQAHADWTGSKRPRATPPCSTW